MPREAVASSSGFDSVAVAPLWLTFSSPSISLSISANSWLLAMFGRYFAKSGRIDAQSTPWYPFV